MARHDVEEQSVACPGGYFFMGYRRAMVHAAPPLGWRTKENMLRNSEREES